MGNFWKKWGSGGFKRSLERKRLRRLKKAAEAERLTAVDAIVSQRFVHCRPMGTCNYLPPNHDKRINVVTDSINAGSLYGGVGTALIIAGLAAERAGCPLRIVTRTQAPETHNVKTLFDLYGIKVESVEFVYLDVNDSSLLLDVREGDTFLTTSWWTTSSALASLPRRSIVYLIQEDERMFYPFGDERLKCDRVMHSADIRYLVNSHLLYEHFQSEGLTELCGQGRYFEPAFPRHLFARIAKKGKKRFFFYARPNNQRNLFYFGIEVIEAFMLQSGMDPSEWEFYFVGKDMPKVSFSGSPDVKYLENLSWKEYCQLVGTIDLALCLMYTPHPSYPPLDLAASGAVVVTNRFMGKTNLDRYSRNILVADLDVAEMTKVLGEGIALVSNEAVRAANARDAGMADDWRVTLDAVVTELVS